MEKCLHIIPRKVARERGLKRYFTGKPCKHGRVAERITSMGQCWCDECYGEVLERSAQYKRNNPDKMAAYKKQWDIKNRDHVKKCRSDRYWSDADKYRSLSRAHYHENKEDISKKQKHRYWQNPDHYRGRAKLWRDANPEKLRLQWVVRSHRKRDADGRHTAEDIKRMLSNQRHKCASCRCNLKKTGYHVDHVIPLARGGTNWPDNLQILCPTCNLQKGAKDPIEWAQESGRLL